MLNVFDSESFGSDCPRNWEEICDYLNAKLDDLTGGTYNGNNRDDREISDKLWEDYCRGDLKDAPEPLPWRYRDRMKPGANLSWCVPYVDKTGSYYAVLCDGKIISIKTPYLETSDFTPEQLKEFAQAVNPDYADYDGWDDTHIILEAMQETGCTECPFFDDCDAMDEETV